MSEQQSQGAEQALDLNNEMQSRREKLAALRKEGIVLRRCEDVNVRDMGYSIYPSEEGISPAARELYEKMQQVDWMMTDREDYFASQRPEAPQGSTSPLVVTGRPIS